MYGLPLCQVCLHFHGKKPDSVTCDAFPEGIPQQVYQGAHDHRKPYPGDGGKTFAPKDIKTETVAESSPDPMLRVLESAGSMEEARRMIGEIRG
jgi:hypothetical protein